MRRPLHSTGCAGDASYERWRQRSRARTRSARRQSAAQRQELEAGEPLSKPRRVPGREQRRASSGGTHRAVETGWRREHRSAEGWRREHRSTSCGQRRAGGTEREQRRTSSGGTHRTAELARGPAGRRQATHGSGHPDHGGGSGGLTSMPRRTRRHTCRGAWGQLWVAPRGTQVPA